MTKRAKEGIWTPSANLFCSDCHGRVEWTRMPGDEVRVIDTRDMDLREQETENERLSTCTVCGCEIWARWDVAACRRAMVIINEADPDNTPATLAQTGGMCCACAVHLSSGAYVYVTDAEDQDDDGVERFCVAAYDPSGMQYECGVPFPWLDGETWTVVEAKDLVATVQRMVEEVDAIIDWTVCLEDQFAWMQRAEYTAQRWAVEALAKYRRLAEDQVQALIYKTDPWTERDVDAQERFARILHAMQQAEE